MKIKVCYFVIFFLITIIDSINTVTGLNETCKRISYDALDKEINEIKFPQEIIDQINIIKEDWGKLKMTLAMHCRLKKDNDLMVINLVTEPRIYESIEDIKDGEIELEYLIEFNHYGWDLVKILDFYVMTFKCID